MEVACRCSVLVPNGLSSRCPSSDCQERLGKSLQRSCIVPTANLRSSRQPLGSCYPLPSFLRASAHENGAPARRLVRVPALIQAALKTEAGVAVGLSELDAVGQYSEVVPDTVIFDDFERFPPTAATASSSLLIGLSGLAGSPFKGCIDSALAFGECYAEENQESMMACFIEKALVNVGHDLAKIVPGRVSTEVSARLAYDTEGIVRYVRRLLKMYQDMGTPKEKLLFKITATWEGIEAARQLEAEGIQTHVTLVYSLAQAVACADAGVSVVQLFVGRIRDWARNHSGDAFVASAVGSGQDPGVSLVSKAYNYITKKGLKTKVMAAAIRNKQDVFSLLGVDFMVVPLKVLNALKSSTAEGDEKYAYAPRLSPALAQAVEIAEVATPTKDGFARAIGPCAEQLLAAGIASYQEQQFRAEEYFSRLWPPPNV